MSFREGLTAPQSWVDLEPGLQVSGQAALGAGHQYWWLSALPSLPGLAGQGGTLATGLAPLQLRGRAEPGGWPCGRSHRALQRGWAGPSSLRGHVG